ncbi:MAG: hypothetical protein DSY91_07290 [Deltaproteobacteria bacterium]|nr:MAG: hypothetical protein DSY91_07290 [Deltaproteobacteria bacterium]
MTIMKTGQEKADPPFRPGSVHHLKSLEKGLALLESFGQDAQAMTLTELAQRCGFHISTVQRLTATLCRLGYLKKDQSKRYHLGLKVIKLGFRVTQTLALRTFLLPYLRDLFEEIDQTVNLFLLEGDEVVIVERLEKRRILQYNLQTGSGLPLYCTASGKAILSHMDSEWVERFLDRVELRAFTPHTLTTRDALFNELDITRERGFAVNVQELALGACAAGVAFFDREGIPCGAISAATPAQHFTMEIVRNRFINPLKRTAEVASQFLGRQEA